jgi:PadR family transcriptional regulator, regulatory protein AphA
VVLGLLARDGPSTPYDLKAAVARGIAQFWPFPHSQIYSEAEYLTSLGLLAHEQERSGRRRRTFRLTDSGRTALSAWLREPTSEVLRIRSYAFLKLYFGYFGTPDDVLRLASAQAASLDATLHDIDGMLERLKVRPDRKWQWALAGVYADLARAARHAWQRVAAHAEQETRGRRRNAADAAEPVPQDRRTRRRATRRR